MSQGSVAAVRRWGS